MAATLKRVCVFSTGQPDPTQGGGGIFNYLVIDHLLSRGVEVRALFRAAIGGIKKHFNDDYVERLKARGLVAEFFPDLPVSHGHLFGMPLLKALHKADMCGAELDKRSGFFDGVDGAISMDLGWAFALANRGPRSVCILADPVHQRMRHSYALVSHPLNPFAWKRRAQVWSMDRAIHGLAQELGTKNIIGSLSPFDAAEYSAAGLACRHFRWCSLAPTAPARAAGRERRDRLVALHVGTLETSASRDMLRFWHSDLLPALGRMGLKIEIRFVGMASERFESKYPNITVTYLGKLDSIDDEFANADVFLSPLNYAIGVRTRVITAMSFGIPVLASPSVAQGLPELIDGRDVLYAKDGESAAKLLEKLHNDPSLGDTVGRAGRETWLKLFNPAVNIPALAAPLAGE